MKNELILETSRMIEIMGIDIPKNIISEQKWLEGLINVVKGDSRYVSKFFNEGPAFKNFDELRSFLNSGNGARFLTKMDDLIADLRRNGKDLKADTIEGLKGKLLSEKVKPIFTVEWAKISQDIKMQTLFSKNPQAELKIKNWLQGEVNAGRSVSNIGMSKIEQQIKSIPGASSSMKLNLVDLANKYVSKGGAKILLGTAIVGAILNLWTITDVIKWLKDIIYKSESDSEDNNSPVEDPDNGGEANW
jgi:hypothetical protein